LGVDSNKCSEGLHFDHFYVQSPCNPLIEDYTEIFYTTDEGDAPSIQCKMGLREPKSMRKVDGLSFIFIDFYVQVLTPCLYNTETSLQLSENTTLFAVSHIYVCHQQRGLERHQVFGAYHLYIQCTMLGTGWNLVAPLHVYPLV
jgi:hypothetical protein